MSNEPGNLWNARRRDFLGLATGGIAGLVWTGLGFGPLMSSAAEPKRGGTLHLLVDPEPTVLVTLTNSADPSLLVSAKVTEGLLTYDFDLNPKPQLATHWWVNPDGTTFKFKLRPGVKWHDGQDFTASDVAFSIMLLKAVHPRGRVTFANVAQVLTPDPHTAVIELLKPAPYLLYALAASESPIVPKHVYDDTEIATNPNASAPVGTGPFVFKEWIRGSHITYERNPNYWDAPKPYLDRLMVRFIPDPAARMLAIETGQIDLAPSTPVPLSEIDRLKANTDLRFDMNGYQYTNQVVRLEFNLDNSYLKQLKVRQAIAHAIDRKAVIASAWYGYAQVAQGPISSDLKRFYATDIPVYTFDPEKSERLLDEAGLPRGVDGIRLRLTHDYVPAGDGYKRTAEYVKQALARVGIDVAVRSQDFSAYIKRIYTDRDFELTTSRMNNMFDPTVGVQRVFWSKNFRRGVPFSNGSHYENSEVDRLLEVAAVEADPIKRFQYFEDFQKIVIRDLPDLTLLAPAQITIYNKKVVDHTVTADGISGNLADVYIRI
jgi:peptide/nickel transport system substrate-binding protein